MKKRLFCLLLAFTLLLPNLGIVSTLAAAPKPAAYIALSPNGKTFTVGDTVYVTLTFDTDKKLIATTGTLTYDNSILEYVSSDHTNSGNTVKIVDNNINVGTTTKVSYRIQFRAKSTGSFTLRFDISAGYLDDATGKRAPDPVTGSASWTMNVVSKTTTTSSKTPVSSTTISKNANLSSIRVKDHELSPAFSSSTTSYTVTARYPVEEVTIFASTQHAEATYVGAGTYELQVGENERIITVTAQDGKTKKTYFITIKRLTEQETEEYDKQNEVTDPLAVQVNGTPYHIAANPEGVTPPAGFTTIPVDYKGNQVTVYESVDKSYTLYWLTNDETGQGDFYTYDFTADVFTLLPYIYVNNVIYILATLPQTYTVPAGYSIVSIPLANTTTTAFVANDPRLTDFYMLYLLYDGVAQFYRFDQAETTLQRAPYFTLNESQPSEAPAQSANGLLEKWKALSSTEKILIYALGGAVLLILILLIIIIILIQRNAKRDSLEPTLEDEDIIPFIDLQEDEIPLVENTEDAPQEAAEDEETPKPNDDESDSR